MHINRINNLINRDLDFALYCLPNDNESYFIAQKRNNRKQATIDFSTDKGFVIHPFLVDYTCPEILIQPEFFSPLSTLKENDIDQLINDSDEVIPPSALPINYSRDEYLQKLNRAIEAMPENKIDKFIFSRIETRSNTTPPFDIFQQLTQKYKNAFVYFFHISGIGSWIGATPEIFAHLNQSSFTTFSLAGTQKNNGQNQSDFKWGQKEIDEQAYVTSFIENTFNTLGINAITEGPSTHLAGPVAHLLSTIKASTNAVRDKLEELLKQLHPTPAVCGFPKEKALDFILKTEAHARKYYTGFLGPVGLHNELQLFVNLRCMQVFENYLALYLGGGITIDSVSENEWQETCDKAETLLSVL